MTSFGDLNNAGGVAFSPASFGGFEGNPGAFSSFSSLSSSFLTHLDLPTPLVDFLCQRHVQPGNEDLSRSFGSGQTSHSHLLQHHQQQQASSSSSTSNYSARDHELLHALQQVTTLLTSSPDQALPHLRTHLLPLLALPPPAGASAFLNLWKQAIEVKSREKPGVSDNYETQVKVQAAVAAARLLRNVVAGENQLQVIVFQRMGAGLLSLLRLGGSLAFSSDPELQPLTRSLVQLLSNLVTLNKPLQKALFHHLRLKPHLRLSDAEAAERVTVVQSLLASPDPGTVEAVQILLLNCIRTSATNSSGLATSLGGRRLLGQLLILFETMSENDEDDDQGMNGGDHDQDHDEDLDEDHEAEDFGVGDLQIEEGVGLDPAHHLNGSSSNSSSSSSKGSTPTMSRTNSRPRLPTSRSSTSTSAAAKRASAAAKKARKESQSASLKIGYAIFAHLFEYGLFKHLYRNLSPRGGGGNGPDDPVVTTEQTLLLKTVDAWINAGAKNHTMNDQSSVDQFRRLPLEMAVLCRFLRGALLSTQSSSNSVPDRRIVGVHQALIIMLEILIQLGMIGCEGLEEDEQFRAECEELLRLMRNNSRREDVVKDSHEEPVDTVEEIVSTLKVSHEFAPPISPFTSNGTANGSMPEGHTATSTGRNTSASAGLRLDNLNKSLIQLLGVLTFQHSPSSIPVALSSAERSTEEIQSETESIKKIQDQVRFNGGLMLLISLLQVDKSNPYIKEHGIFTLKYLLQGNLENQSLVEQLKPVY
ncbi:unnamed protein product [Sympodiomycopsis kandeliae]